MEEKIVIVSLEKGMLNVDKKPKGVTVHLVDYDVNYDIEEEYFDKDEYGNLCSTEIYGPDQEW